MGTRTGHEGIPFVLASTLLIGSWMLAAISDPRWMSEQAWRPSPPMRFSNQMRYIAQRLHTSWLSSSFEKYLDILKLQATTASTFDEARSAIESMEIYGYKAVPAIRDIMEVSTDKDVKKLCTLALKNAGWLP